MIHLLRYKRRYIHFLITLFISLNIYAQEEEDFQIPDSLKSKSFDYLYEHASNNYTDTVSSIIYLNTALKKAIQENRKANESYSLLLLAHYGKDKYDRLQLIKKSLEKTKGIDSIHALLPHYKLGQYYYSHFEYDKALQEYLKAYNISKKAKEKRYEFASLSQIAELKAAIGNHQEAVNMYSKYLQYENSLDKKNAVSITNTLVNLAESMRYLKKHDSASYYYNSILKNGYTKDSYYFNIATINQGINLYEIGNYEESEALLKNGFNAIDLNYASNHKYYVLSQFYLGKINQLVYNNIQEAKRYFLKVDSSFTTTDVVIPETRYAYEFLIAHYRKQENFKAQLNTINKLLQFDSIKSSRKTRTISKLYSEYDTPQLLKNKEALIQQLENEARTHNTKIIYLIIFILLLSILFIIQYFRHRKYRHRFNTIILELNNRETKSTSNHNTSNVPKPFLEGIDENTITTILHKLDQFEEKKEFLQKDITLAILAKKCTTNTKYLPKIISIHKDKSFVNYINSLRIDYILKELRENTILQKYTIKTISEEAGFNTAESFARAFKNKTGIRPSYYIRTLKKEENN